MRAPGFGTIGFVVLVAVVLTTGCGSVPPVQHYLLASPGTEPLAAGAPAAGDGPLLRVAELDIAPPYGDDRLVYRIVQSPADDPQEVGFYEQHRWAAPPAALVTEALLEGLRARPDLSAVEPGDWRPGTLALSGRVLWLEELDLPAGPTARVGLDLELHNPDGQLLWQRRFMAERKGSAQDVAQIVALLREALVEVVGEVGEAVAAGDR